MNHADVNPRPQARCSYCGELFVIADLRLMPFCSRRCKEIDLAHWLSEGYGLPYECEAETTDDRPDGEAELD